MSPEGIPSGESPDPVAGREPAWSPKGLVATSREGARRVSEPVAGEGARGARDPSVSDLFLSFRLLALLRYSFRGFRACVGTLRTNQ